MFTGTFSGHITGLKTTLMTTLVRTIDTVRNLLRNVDRYAGGPGANDLAGAAAGSLGVVVSAGRGTSVVDWSPLAACASQSVVGESGMLTPPIT